MVQKLENEVTDGSTKNPPSPKSRLAVLKRNKKASNATAADPFRFQGQGVTYKGKLIGERDVEGARGDSMCADAMRAAKAAVKAAGSHKTRIQLQINIEGIKIVDEKSNAVLHNFPVSRISFIARDTSDARAFGLIFGDATNKYKFYGIKTAQTSDQAVLAIRDMFQVVFEMKKKQIEQVKQQQQENPKDTTPSAVAVADLLDLETELHNIEQGVHQLQQIPTDAFGATPFADPFTDSFASNNTSCMTNSMNNSNMSNGGNISSATQQSFAAFPPPAQNSQHVSMQQQPWPQVSQQPQSHQQQAFPAHPVHHVQSQPVFSSNFSETNPFASVASFAPPPSTQMNNSDPFAIVPQQQQPAQQTIDWGVNENAVPNMHHANSFAAFDSQPKSDYKWEESKRVTSLEEAFTKLVDMDTLVGPAETKKNPFEHIINPPKASLNSLGSIVPQRPAPVSGASDPFGDEFFR